MTDFNPGPGWREATELAHEPVGHYDVIRFWDSDERKHHTWVREEPVPPLPTEPGVYIDSDGEPWRRSEDTWYFGSTPYYEQVADEMKFVEGCGPFTRLEPRAVTAKAVLEHIESMPWARDVDLTNWRRKFGVES